jgi:hypothetical protein
VINPAAIPKFVDPLPVPGSQWPVLTGQSHTILLKRVGCQVLPQNAADFPRLHTPCWGYRTGTAYIHTYLGPTVVGISGKNIRLTFDYSAIDPTHHLLRTGDAAAAGAVSVVDKHVHGTDMGEPEVRFVAHRHGNVGIGARSDGYSESWVTPDDSTFTFLTRQDKRPIPRS